MLETDLPKTSSTELRPIACELVCAYMEHNKLPAQDLGALIGATYDSLARLGTEPEAKTLLEPVVGAVSLRKSLASPEHIVSMIDGKPYRMLKRHLSGHGMTPREYRIRYGLPSDYPMVAPAYREARSAMAKRLGLGRKPAVAPVPSRRKLKIAGPKDG